MTERLVDEPDGVSVLAARVAEARGLPVTHVEKDFWVTEVLRGVVAAAEDLGAHVLFKGGTSLSKVFNVINRFSEDVDMLVVLEATGAKADHERTLKALVAGAEKATKIDGVVDGSTATKGVKRAARFRYPTPHPVGAGLSEGVLLELGSRGGALEAAPAPVNSLISQHAADAVAGFAEAEPVHVRVMAPWRTLVEKLVLLHTAHLEAEATRAVKGARHYYDVHQLLNRTEVLSGLIETGVGALARDVCLYSREAGLAAEDRPAGGFAASPAFTDGPHVQAAREEYDRRVVGELLWPGPPQPTFDECLATVQHHAEQI